MNCECFHYSNIILMKSGLFLIPKPLEFSFFLLPRVDKVWAGL